MAVSSVVLVVWVNTPDEVGVVERSEEGADISHGLLDATGGLHNRNSRMLPPSLRL